MVLHFLNFASIDMLIFMLKFTTYFAESNSPQFQRPRQPMGCKLNQVGQAVPPASQI